MRSSNESPPPLDPEAGRLQAWRRPVVDFAPLVAGGLARVGPEHVLAGRVVRLRMIRRHVSDVYGVSAVADFDAPYPDGGGFFDEDQRIGAAAARWTVALEALEGVEGPIDAGMVLRPVRARFAAGVSPQARARAERRRAER